MGTIHYAVIVGASAVAILGPQSVFGLEPASPEPHILGLSMGMDVNAVREIFTKHNIALNEADENVLAAPSGPDAPEGTREVRLSFENGALAKIVIRFDVPPHDPTAAALILAYEKEKARLTKQLGSPGSDMAQNDAPGPEYRYEWIRRGRAYYRTVWSIPKEMKVTLWLYADDPGIVFMEVYEAAVSR